jgi:tRNA (uracil-5-)-methyltransferase
VVEDAAMDADGSTEWKFTEAEFKVVNLTSHGDGIAIHPREGPPEWAVIIPFTLPGDIVKAKVTRNLYYHSFAEPVALPTRSSYEPPTVAGTAASPSTFPLPLHRDPSLPQCRYFSTCAGCQYQWLSYAEQLAIKRLVVQKAMRNFSGLEEGVDWPEVGETIPSPKQYGYRTKITPHFDLPKELQTGKKGRRAVQKTPKQSQSATTQINEEEVSNEGIVALQPAHPEFGDLPIGFNEACRSKIMDIEECPIATEVINERLPAVRQEVKLNIREYKRGATLLFRDSLVVKGQQVDAVKSKDKGKAIEHVDKADVLDDRVCITAHHQTITEKVGDIVFQVRVCVWCERSGRTLTNPTISSTSSQLDRSFKTTRPSSYR